MNSRPVFFRNSRNRRKAASAPSMRPKALSGSIAKYSRGLALSVLSGSAALLAVSALLSMQSAQAANIILYDGDTSTVWNAGGNWTGGIAPTNDLTTDIAKFDLATYAFQPTATSNGNINGIIMGASSGAITITTSLTTSRLNIGTGGIVMDAGTGTLTIGTAATQGVTLGASQSWTNNSSSLLTVSSVANDANVTPFTLTLDGSGSGGTTISNIITNGGATGTTALIVNMSGTGVVTLSGANTLTGGIALNQGTLVATVIGAFGTSANTLTFGGGNLDLRAATNAAVTYTGALNLNSTNQTISVNTAAATDGLTHLISGALTLGTQTTTVSAGSNINTNTNYGLTLSGAKTFAVSGPEQN